MLRIIEPPSVAAGPSGPFDLGDLEPSARPVADPGWGLPGAIASNMERNYSVTNLTAVASGTLRVAGGCILPRGVEINSVSFKTGDTGLTTPTHQWMCILDQSRNVLAKTVDNTNVAWGAQTVRTLALSAPYTPAEDTPVYLGLLITAATVGTSNGIQSSTSVTGLTPIMAASSTAGLTDPASLGAVAGALTAIAGFSFCCVS